VASFGLLLIAFGMVYGRDASQNYLVAVLGAVVLFTGLYAWALEPSTEPDDHHEAEAEVEIVEEPAEEPAALTTGEGEEG
jgi:hypothetical protein